MTPNTLPSKGNVDIFRYIHLNSTVIKKYIYIYLNSSTTSASAQGASHMPDTHQIAKASPLPLQSDDDLVLVVANESGRVKTGRVESGVLGLEQNPNPTRF